MNALVEPGVRDGDGDLCRERGERALVIVVVVVDARVFEVEYADYLALIDERDGEFGAGLGVDREVARILAYIGGEDGLAELSGGADEAFSEGDGAFSSDALAVAGARSGARTAACVRSTAGW